MRLMWSKEASMEKRENEAKGRDGVVTMRHIKKRINGAKIVYM